MELVLDQDRDQHISFWDTCSIIMELVLDQDRDQYISSEVAALI